MRDERQSTLAPAAAGRGRGGASGKLVVAAVIGLGVVLAVAGLIFRSARVIPVPPSEPRGQPSPSTLPVPQVQNSPHLLKQLRLVVA